MKAIIDALRGKNPTMGGMVGEAQKNLQNVPSYKAYSIEKMTNGETPVSYEQFLKGMR